MSEIGKPDGERNSYGETSCLIGLVNCLSGLAGGRFFLERAVSVTALYDSSSFIE